MKNITIALELDNETENKFFLSNTESYEKNKLTLKDTHEHAYTVEGLLAEFSEEGEGY